MKKIFILGSTFIGIVFAFLAFTSQYLFAAPGINAQIPFQGMLKDASSTPLTGDYDMTFSIYASETGGVALWTDTFNSVPVAGGTFSILLGSGLNPLTLDFNDDSYYLGITIGSDTEMTPRERMGASGYAINSKFLGGLDGSAFMQAGSILPLSSGGLNLDVSAFADGIFGLNNGVSTDIDTELELETALSGLNIISSGEIGTSLDFSSILSDETGTGLFVLNRDATLDGLTTFSDYMATNGITTYASSTNLFSTILTATNGYFSNLSFGNVDGVMVTGTDGTVSVASTFDISGEISASHYVGTGNVLSSFAGPIELTSLDASYSFSDLNFEDNAGILFGNNGVDTGIRIYQDLTNYGGSDLVFTPPTGSTYVNLTTSGEMWLMANNSDGGCSSGCEPSLVLAEDGSATISNTGFGTDKYFTMNFTDGVRIPTGNLGIGIESPQVALDVFGTIRSSDLEGGMFELESDVNGNIVKGPPAPSDERLKKNISTINNALDMVLGLRGVRYEWKDTDTFGLQTEVGFVAQEVNEILPEVVRDNGTYLLVNTKNIVAVVVEAIKELNTKVENYFTRTERLEAEVADLRNEILILKGERTATSQSSMPPSETVLDESIVNEEVTVPREEPTLETVIVETSYVGE